jgi:hypothetical protein
MFGGTILANPVDKSISPGADGKAMHAESWRNVAGPVDMPYANGAESSNIQKSSSKSITMFPGLERVSRSGFWQLKSLKLFSWFVDVYK